MPLSPTVDRPVRPRAGIRILTVSFGGISISLSAGQGVFSEDASARYGAYKGKDAGICLDVTVRSVKFRGSFWPKVWKRGNRMGCRSSQFRWDLDLAAKTGRVEMVASPQALDSVLRTLFASLAPLEGAVLMHGAAAVYEGKGYLFLGPSGAGKTTLSGVLQRDPKTTVLTDELVLLRQKGTGFDICGTPFWGEFRKPQGPPGDAPLRAIHFLSKTEGELRLREVSAGESQPAALKCLVAFHEDTSLLQNGWDLLSDALQGSLVRELAWSKGTEAAVLWKALRRG